MSSYHDVLRRHQGLSGSFTAASAPTLTSADVAAPFAATAATQAVPKLTEPRSRDEHIEAPSWYVSAPDENRMVSASAPSPCQPFNPL